MQKFIITDDGLFKYGDVKMHKDLLSPMEECLGGGFWEINAFEGRLYLYGRSYDYGEPRWGHIEELRMPSALRGLKVPYDDEELEVDIRYV